MRIAAAELLLDLGSDVEASTRVLVSIVQNHPRDAAVLAEALAAMERTARKLAGPDARAVCAQLPDSDPAWNKRIAPKVALLRDRVLAELPEP